MNEWKGRQRCEQCGKQGDSFWGQLVSVRGWHYLDEEKRCTGRIVPYDRRTLDPEKEEKVKALLRRMARGL